MSCSGWKKSSCQGSNFFSFPVQVIDLLAIAVLNRFSAQFESGGQCAVVCGEFIWHEKDSLQSFVPSQTAIYLGDDTLVQGPDFRIINQIAAGSKRYAVGSRPLLE